jgi:ArsR family transcriptional regulator
MITPYSANSNYAINDKIRIYILTTVNVSVSIHTSKEAVSMGFREDVRKVKALADENRLAIMLALQHGEKCGCVLLEELNITQPTLSHHMKILCDSGLVASRKEGKWMHYSLSPEGIASYREMIFAYVRCDCEKEETTPACCCK